MQIAYNWLSEYLPFQIEVEELSEILTNIGLEVEAVEKFESIKGSLEGIIAGHVLSCKPHPNADKLKLTTVDIGNDIILPIVCGAPNVAEGQKVIIATVGTTIYPTNGESFTIKKAKIRGEVSEGMICAEDEIGLGENHEGIIILPEHILPGTAAIAIYNLPPAEYIYTIGLTPNRSDAMSHLGVATDVCAYKRYHEKNVAWIVKKPNLPEQTIIAHKLPISIKNEIPLVCKRYAGIVLSNVEVMPSPEWLLTRLKSIGVRPVNNIVDVTNYILHEYGQPLHAFDYNAIKGHEIIIKNYSENTPFKTLDSKERKLKENDIIISDHERPLCIAGVMGGENSEVTNMTTTLFIESAWFDPKVIRKTSLEHNIRSEAAVHFEKTVDITSIIPALKRAIQLIQEISGALISSEIIDLYPTPVEERSIEFKYQYINTICGKQYTSKQIEVILKALNFHIKEQTETGMLVIVPANKSDVKQAADVAEEILRIDGLNNIEIPNRLNISLNAAKGKSNRYWREKLSQHLTGLGLQEIITNSITNSKYYPDYPHSIHMINSLSSELNIMRPEMILSGLEVVAYNINRKQLDLQLYEIGNVYYEKEAGKYKQENKLAIWLTGNKNVTNWNTPNEKVNIYYAKGILNSLMDICGIKKLQEQNENGELQWRRGKQVIAKLAEVPTEQLKLFDIKQPVIYLEINVAEWINASQGIIKFKEIGKFPSMKRDLALIINKEIPFAEIEAIAYQQKWEALQDFTAFDVFENEKIGKDKKSIAVSFTFQIKDRTLTDKEVDDMMNSIILQYQNKLSATIRE